MSAGSYRYGSAIIHDAGNAIRAADKAFDAPAHFQDPHPESHYLRLRLKCHLR